MDFINLPVLLFSLLLTISILTSLVSRRIGIPLILTFLCIGLTISTGNFDVLQGLQRPRIVFFIGSVALAMILFDSGFHTSMKNYRQNAKPALLLSTVGVILTALLLAPFVKWILNIGWTASFLLVSIISSTDSAAVFSLLRSKGLGLREKVKSTLEIESGTNDPMAIFLTLAFIVIFQKQLAGDEISYTFLLPSLLQQAFIGAVVGAGMALIIRLLVNKVHLETALYPIFVLGLSLFVFSVTNMLGGSGFLAVYISGLLLGNSRLQAYAQISKFQQTLTWLGQITMFACLGMFVTPSGLNDVWSCGFWFSVILMFMARPIMIFTILGFFKKFTVNEKIFISFVGLRGATSFLLAIIPIVLELPYAQTFFDIVFVMVLISLAVQGFTIPIVGRWCGVTIPQLESAPIITQIDLPGLVDSSLVMYQLDEQSPVIRGEKIPRWAKPSLVIRNGVSYPAGIGLKQLKPKDKVYVFLSSELQRSALDKMFGQNGVDENANLGDFPLSGTTTFEEIEHLYGIQVDRGIRNSTIRQLFDQEFSDVEIGDRLILGSIELVVRSIKRGHVVDVGIDIDPKSSHHLHEHIKRLTFRELKKKLTKSRTVVK